MSPDDYETKGMVLCMCLTGICIVVIVCIILTIKTWGAS